MKKIVIVFFVLFMFGVQKNVQAKTWPEFLKNSNWRMQNSDKFLNIVFRFSPDTITLEIENPVTEEKQSGKNAYNISGNIITVYFPEQAETTSFALTYVNENKIMLDQAVYARLGSNEDKMFYKLVEYKNPHLFGSPSITPSTTPSTQNNATQKLCYACYGLKICPTCKGARTTSYYGHSNTCNGCKGSGICWRCNGTGHEK